MRRVLGNASWKDAGAPWVWSWRLLCMAMTVVFFVLYVLLTLIFVDDEEVVGVKEEWEGLYEERVKWEGKNDRLRLKIEGLRGTFPDYDLLEEEVRGVLHYGRSGDIVLSEVELLP